MSKKFCPAYHPPAKNKLALWWRTLFGSGSLLEQITRTGYRMHMGHVRAPGAPPSWAINDPKTVRKVLIEHNDDFPKHPLMDDLLAPLLGRSIFTANGDAWRRRRKMMESAFEVTRMEHAFPLMRAAADALLERLRALPEDSPWEVEPEMSHYAVDVIHRTVFSKALDAENARRIFHAFATFQQATTVASQPRYRVRWWRKLAWGPHAQRTQEAAEVIRSLLLAEIQPRYDAYRAGQPGPEVDILGSLLEAREEGSGQPLTLEELLNEIAVIYLAGHETSASALSWTLHLVAHDQDVQRRVHAELDTVLGPNQAIELRQLPKLDLLRRVFREGLRLFPPLGFLVRESRAPTCLRNQQVQQGALVFISPWLIQRHHRYWERPDEFDPDRFLTEAGRASAASAYLPFSLGPRVCVGAGFALQESALALATVLRAFALQPVPARRCPMPVAHLTLRSDIGIQLLLQKR